MSRVDIPYSGPGRKCDAPGCDNHSEVETITRHAWCGEDFCAACMATHAAPCEAEPHLEGCLCEDCVDRAAGSYDQARDAAEDR